MTPEQLAELKRWAEQLRRSEQGAETRAAARAILRLVEEVEQLRSEPSRRLPPDEDGDDEGPPTARKEPRRAPILRVRRGRRSRREAPYDADAQVEPEAQLEVEPPSEHDLRASAIADERQTKVLAARSRSRRARIRLAVASALLLAFAVGAYSATARIASPDLEAHGPPAGAKIGQTRLEELVFWVQADRDTLEHTKWKLDGAEITADARLAGDRLVYDGTGLPDGTHTLEIRADGPFPGADASRSWHFAVDATPPKIRLPKTDVEVGASPRLSGTTEQGTTLRALGGKVSLDGGRFTVSYPGIPPKPVTIVATDSFGNIARRTFRLTLVPRRPPAPVRAVHVTAQAWATPDLRRSVLDLLAQGRINAVELDLKDESGVIGFDADVPLGRRIGSVQAVYDLDKAVRLLHARGAWVIGRLVAFRDPIHASAAWKAGNRDQVVQAPGGEPYSGYGGFTNFANRAVQQYNIDIAREAADGGIDDILYDYVRRPDGPTSSMVFPGLKGTPEAAIAAFLRETRRALPPSEVYLGASVFGVAATRPTEVAQDIPMMARHVDYVSPMLYPSHWGPGEYGVAFPNGQPYDIVLRSLRDFKTQTRGTGARVVPWLQDFTLGVDYGPNEVRAQIRAARDAGIDEWILWDPLVTYTTEALDRHHPGAPRRTNPEAASTTAREPEARAPKGRAGPKPAAVRANELGEIPVIMYHQIREDGGGEYDLTPAEFRAELRLLYRQGYRPVRAVDLVRGTLDVPAGTSPVVLTFDDSTKEQFSYGPDGKIAQKTALGIMLDFARRNPRFKPAGTFYVNREPFAGVAEGDEMLRFLVEHGFELGNHTDDHVPFNRKDAAGVQSALVRGKRLIVNAVPGAQVRTMALPLGVPPEPERLAARGSWNGDSYRHEGVFLVGAEPAPSPFSRTFDPLRIPRIRTGPWRGGEPDYASGFWLDLLRENPERRYVSDGDPRRISFPAERRGELAARFSARANPY